MAGSLNHIVADDGSFKMSTIENLRDAREALEECYDIIAYLCDGDRERLAEACRAFRYPVPDDKPFPPPRSALTRIQPPR